MGPSRVDGGTYDEVFKSFAAGCAAEGARLVSFLVANGSVQPVTPPFQAAGNNGGGPESMHGSNDL